jgi:hypothetical protein
MQNLRVATAKPTILFVLVAFLAKKEITAHDGSCIRPDWESHCGIVGAPEREGHKSEQET